MGGGISKTTQSASERKLAERERLIVEMERELGLASEHPEDLEMISLGPKEIVDNLKSRKEGWTVEKVMKAYIRKACEVQRKTNCLTEIMFRQALDEAIAKDREYAERGVAEGRFWGLPSSFKDTYDILGFDTSLGTSPKCFHPIEDPDLESALVILFRQGGGIPFCKTNVPQTLLSFECRNPIFGGTDNPYDSTRTCGGSSGGEAVMVTMGGTPIGWGSDNIPAGFADSIDVYGQDTVCMLTTFSVGGSLRIPAGYSGCCSLKPWPGRLPIMPSGNREEVQDGIKWMLGPMARNVSDLTFVSEGIYSLAQAQREQGKMIRQRIMPVPWREVDLPKRLKVGYWIEDGSFKTSPACARAVRMSVEALEKAGHEVKLFEPPSTVEMFKCFVALSSAEGYRARLESIGPDPMEPSMRLVTLGSKIPWFVHRGIELAAEYIKGDKIFAEVFGAKPVYELWRWNARRDQYIIDFYKAAWEEGGYDMLICPVQAVPALKHNETKLLSPLSITTVLLNMVDSTVGVIPITRVVAELDRHPPDFLAGSTGSKILEDRVYKGPKAAYNADEMDGLPVGVQVIGKAWEEEKVLGMMKVLEDLAGYA